MNTIDYEESFGEIKFPNGFEEKLRGQNVRRANGVLPHHRNIRPFLRRAGRNTASGKGLHAGRVFRLCGSGSKGWVAGGGDHPRLWQKAPALPARSSGKRLFQLRRLWPRQHLTVGGITSDPASALGTCCSCGVFLFS